MSRTLSMTKILVAALLLLPGLAFATAETLRPITDNADGGASAAYASSPTCSSGTNCTAVNCALNVDDTVASGDAAMVSGTTCSGSGASSWTQSFNLSTPTVGTDWDSAGTNVLAMRYFEPDSDGTDPSWSSVEVRCSGASITTCSSWTAFNGTTEVADTTSCTFSGATAISSGCSPSSVYVLVSCSASGGNPGNRRSCALDAVELQGQFVTTTTTTTLAGRSRRVLMNLSQTHDLTDVIWDLVKGWFSLDKAEAAERR